MKNLAIIPARGGSKRIPQKNIKSFNGKAILNYSIAAALESGLFCEVMVSTDSEEIAGIARQAGAVVPFLRSELTAGDYATTEDVLREVLAEYQKRGQEFDYMACIYPTAPFVTAEKLRQGMELLIKRECALVMPVVKFSYPPQRAVIIKGNRL
ncbi:MAG: pseudaminic acid cytidylyltransferase, partial [Syntrophomonadaceae bacterium]